MLIEIGDLMSRSYQLYKKNFSVYVKYILLSLLPILVFLPLTLIFAATGTMLKTNGWPIIILLGTLGLVIVIAAVVFGFVLNIAFIKTIYRLFLQQPYQSVGTMLREGLKVFWRALGVSILVGVYVIWPFLIGMLGLFVLSTNSMSGAVQTSGGIRLLLGLLFLAVFCYGIFHLVYHSLRLGFSSFAVMLDNKGATESLPFSRSLVQNRWWTILGRFFVPGLVVWAIIFGYQIATLIISLLVKNGSVETGLGFLSSVLQLLLTPFLLTCYVILYHSAKENPPPAAPAVASAQ